MPSPSRAITWDDVATLGAAGWSIDDAAVRQIILALPKLFKSHLIANGIEEAKAQAVVTKFRDAGRRSAPWSAFSRRVPGRPQDGADGNRINRWLLPEDHKYFADERTATLVEIKYYLQALAMEGAPRVPNENFRKNFAWLTGFEIEPGNYLEPITLLPVKFETFIGDLRNMTSGHISPLDRGGKHEPQNTFLVTRESNMLQGNNTLPELLEMIEGIIHRHRAQE